MTVSGDATSANFLGRPEQPETPVVEHTFATGVSVVSPWMNVPGTENPTIFLISSTKKLGSLKMLLRITIGSESQTNWSIRKP